MQSEQLAELMREEIRAGTWAAGQPLVQEELAKRYQVSRIPIREALLMLASGGLVTSRAGGGHAVKELSAEEVDELYDLRLQIEPSLSPYIVENASPRQLRDWRTLLRELNDTPRSSPEWVKKNFAFHLSMYEAAQRPHSLRLVKLLLDLTFSYVQVFMSHTDVINNVEQEHDEMLNFIEKCDASGLEATIREHLQTTQRCLSANLRDV